MLSILLGGIGIGIMMVREVWQSNKYGFQVEQDDIVRYSIIGAIGYLVNVIALWELAMWLII
jgi:hypothetical protein